MAQDIQLTTGTWIDVSVSLFTGMVHWPNDPSIEIERIMDIEKGDEATVSKLSMGVHTGTHMDAPLHFFEHGISMDRLPFSATLGRARVIAINDNASIKPAELEPHNIQMGERILFKTRNSTYAWGSNTFVEDFVYISHAAAQYLAQLQVQTVGVDYLSVGGYRSDGPETHHALLGAGIWIIEGLNLAQISPGLYDLICLPLKLLGAEGAPARAILRPLQENG
jgi:arylformamidase